MVNRPKKKGTAAETSALRWLESNGYDVVRNPPAGALDIGDLTVWSDGNRVVVEVKAVKDLARGINEGLAELDNEMVNADTEHGLLLIKRTGKGDPGEWLAIRKLRNDPEIGER